MKEVAVIGGGMTLFRRHLKETGTHPPDMILNTLWGALATELWLQKTLG